MHRLGPEAVGKSTSARLAVSARWAVHCLLVRLLRLAGPCVRRIHLDVLALLAPQRHSECHPVLGLSVSRRPFSYLDPHKALERVF